MLALLPLIIPLILFPISITAGTFGGQVINLDAKQFKKVMASEHASMVAFYAPWCGHCKSLAPKYEASASSLSPLIPFYAIDCDAGPNKPLCGEYGIKGFPTIKAFPRGSKGAAKDYNGPRETGDMVDYAKSLVPDRVMKLRIEGDGKGSGVDKVLQKFLDEKSKLPHVLLIHPSAPSIPFLWKVLAHRLSGKMHLGYIKDSSSHSVLSNLGLYDAPDTSRDATRAVYWEAGADKSKLIEYDGILKFNALFDWLSSQSSSPSSNPSSNSDSDSNSSSQSKTKPKAKSKSNSKASSDSKTQAQEKAAQKILEEALREEKVQDTLEGQQDVPPVDGTPVDAPPPQPESEFEDVDVDSPVQWEEDEGAADPVPADFVREPVETGRVTGEL